MTLTIAIGPESPEFGSWNWIGCDLLKGLQPTWRTVAFSDPANPPPADVTVFLKFRPPSYRLKWLREQTRLVFMPVDLYESAHQIDSERAALQMFDLILVHCQRLVRYFSTAAPTAYVDHALRFVTAHPLTPPADGSLLWVGRRCNIGPIVSWCNQHTLDREVEVLTNGTPRERNEVVHKFNKQNVVHVRPWTPELHIEAMRRASAALDIKGGDFRSRHKPPAKVLDFLASGLPVIVNRGSSADLHLLALGIDWPRTPAWLDGTDELVEHRISQAEANALRVELSIECIVHSLCRSLKSVFDGRIL